MHEGNFTQQIVNSILSELDKVPEGRTQRVKVKVGEMLHLNTDSVQAHFASMTRGTRLEVTRLELEEIPTQVRCRQCHRVWKPEDHHYLFCDSCHKSDVEILTGQAVEIEAIDLEI